MSGKTTSTAPITVWVAEDGTRWDQHGEGGAALDIVQPGPWFHRNDRVWLTRAQVERHHGPLTESLVVSKEDLREIRAALAYARETACMHEDECPRAHATVGFTDTTIAKLDSLLRSSEEGGAS